MKIGSRFFRQCRRRVPFAGLRRHLHRVQHDGEGRHGRDIIRRQGAGRVSINLSKIFLTGHGRLVQRALLTASGFRAGFHLKIYFSLS